MSLSKFITYCLCGILIISCTSENKSEYIPELPSIHYNPTKQQLTFIKNDSSAYDTAFVEIEGVYKKKFLIDGSISLSIKELLKEQDEIKLAYSLYNHDNKLKIKASTSRTNDTIFNYIHKKIDITPIPIAKVIYGNCSELYDVNFQRDYRDKIRLWVFKHDITPDSLLIEGMNSLMKQFNYTGHKEYSISRSNSYIVNSLKGLRFKFNVTLPGKYYYLYAGRDGIKQFIEDKISRGLVDAHYSTSDMFICEQEGLSGSNCLYMIGIDDNWKYKIIPCGVIYVDNISPRISIPNHASAYNNINNPGTRTFNQLLGKTNESDNQSGIYIGNGINLQGGAERIFLEKENIVVDIPEPSESINSNVHVSYGAFQGYGTMYNIPFEVAATGDAKTITIGGHKLNANDLSGFTKTIRLIIPNLHVGDNSIPITATDVRGNKEVSTMHIRIVPINYNNDYDYDYDELDERISDIESRLEELE